MRDRGPVRRLRAAAGRAHRSPLARLDRGADEPGYLLRGLPEVLGFVGP
ncbi:hypothetical protein ACFQV2_06960 [Actinokineospora soli]|uniref:Uncharacterized protein n=1 Tax=Actinokineospora soli TaxID=1048753 RepID=A0ABW2TI36_9PSEU